MQTQQLSQPPCSLQYHLKSFYSLPRGQQQALLDILREMVAMNRERNPSSTPRLHAVK